MTDDVFRHVCLAAIISRMNEWSLSLPGKQVASMFAKDKN